MLQSLRVQIRERNSKKKKKEREHFVIHIMIIKKLISISINLIILEMGSSMRMMLFFEYENIGQ